MRSIFDSTKLSADDVDALIEAFKSAGATVTPGTGKLFVNGQETTIVESLKSVLENSEVDKYDFD